MEYHQLDTVVYGSHGVCTVALIEEKIIDHKPVQYYVLSPLTQPGAMYYVPMHNAAAVSKMRLPLTRDEVLAMLRDNAPDMSAWITEENQRKFRYRELIAYTDPKAVYGMVSLLRQHRDAQLSQGKKFHICDANFLKDGENLLVNEISFVLGIDRAEAMNML